MLANRKLPVRCIGVVVTFGETELSVVKSGCRRDGSVGELMANQLAIGTGRISRLLLVTR